MQASNAWQQTRERRGDADDAVAGEEAHERTTRVAEGVEAGDSGGLGEILLFAQ